MNQQSSPSTTDSPNGTAFLPVLLGTGANAYGLARGFFREFGVKSLAVGPAVLLQCRNSKYVDTRLIPDLAEDEHFVPELTKLAKELKAADPNRQLLIVACGDTTAALLAHHRDAIAEHYLTASVDGATLDRAVDKVEFWKLCEEAEVNTPATAAYTYEDHRNGTPVPEPGEFPLELKAADSVQYLDVQFEGRKKAYTIHSREELNTVARKIYEAGYRGDLVIQEFIPGDDTEMRTLNAYVNMDGSIAMMCMGNPIMEEYAPSRIGNYAAILSEGDSEVYRQCAKLLKTLGYTGFANFDIKRDPRDGSYRFFELNPRPGGSSDFTTCSGYNLAAYIGRDLVQHRHADTELCFDSHLWMEVPPKVFRKYAPEGPVKNKALELLDKGEWSRSAHDRDDRNFKRSFELLRWQRAISRDFAKYTPER
ncbi:hypothetical protein KIH75_02100 [Bifidobacterium sp. 64T4]|uniref:carboxylate--amine ligase n=1 Tax=Bifidobacterium pongonis TaxID=2834432 RepID=UPI001C57E930|nr:hypothetical protein [Bifidobacterium pongonis]MBW3094159.1 hypothetical protein [Bifidobacterium pongonis]